MSGPAGWRGSGSSSSATVRRAWRPRNGSGAPIRARPSGIFTDDPSPGYYRAALTNYLLGELREDQLWAVSPDFYESLGIRRVFGRVVGVDTQRGVVWDTTSPTPDPVRPSAGRVRRAAAPAELRRRAPARRDDAAHDPGRAAGRGLRPAAPARARRRARRRRARARVGARAREHGVRVTILERARGFCRTRSTRSPPTCSPRGCVRPASTSCSVTRSWPRDRAGRLGRAPSSRSRAARSSAGSSPRRSAWSPLGVSARAAASRSPRTAP